MQAQGHRMGWSGGICRNYPSRAEGRTLRQREQCVQRLRGLENRGIGCGACASEFLQLGAEWVGEDRGGDTERDRPQPPGAQPGGTELPSEVPRVQNKAALPGLQCVCGRVGWTPARWMMVCGPLDSFFSLGVMVAGPLGLPSCSLSQTVPGEENRVRDLGKPALERPDPALPLGPGKPRATVVRAGGVEGPAGCPSSEGGLHTCPRQTHGGAEPVLGHPTAALRLTLATLIGTAPALRFRLGRPLTKLFLWSRRKR